MLTAPLGILAANLDFSGSILSGGKLDRDSAVSESKETIKSDLQIHPMSGRPLFQTRLIPYRVHGAH